MKFEFISHYILNTLLSLGTKDNDFLSINKNERKFKKFILDVYCIITHITQNLKRKYTCAQI